MEGKGARRDFFNRSTGSSRQTDDVHMGQKPGRLARTGGGPSGGATTAES